VAIKAAFERGAVRPIFLRYTQAMLTQMALTTVCTRHHLLRQRLCRLLLLHLDRVRGDTLKMTHEQIAHMLGCRREGITEEAFKLQAAGLIRYARGRIKVLDRAGLAQRTCECYALVNREYDRLLPESRLR
jgi:CRP-like cAMP-binding protein